jgi:hypothetical protein
MERANMSRRSLSETEKEGLRQAASKRRQFEGEKRSASAVRSLAIDREMRQLNDRCERIIGAQ